MDSIRLALSLLSVLPVGAQVANPQVARQSIALAPLVGALVGLFGATVLWTSTFVGAPPLLAGLLTVATLVAATRGMHVDGLADTVDGLGCYGSAERSLAVMRDGNTGPFAVVALGCVLGAQAVSIGALSHTGNWVAIVFACTIGRAAMVLCCHKSIPAARQEGLGALVAGSQSNRVVLGWWVALAAAGAVLLPDMWWLGVIAVAVTGMALLLFVRHVVHRFGGITGDVLGATCEGTTATVLALCTLTG